MRKLLITLTLGLTACGNATPFGPDTSTTGAEAGPKAGYSRFTPTPMDVAPGEDQTWCQWVAAPAEADMDLIDITGSQTFSGHHALLCTTSVSAPVGTSRPCSLEDLATMKTLGGVGGESRGVDFPKGVAIRVHKGESLLMNTHYLNTSNKMVTGHSTLDVRFVEPSPDHVLASAFASMTTKFSLTPHAETTADVTTVLPHDVKFIILANHMHEFGTRVFTEEIMGGAATEVQRDKSWAYELQFNPRTRMWPVDAPYVMKAGEAVHTQCTWQNTTADAMTFPREMCIFGGFIIADKDLICIDGKCNE